MIPIKGIAKKQVKQFPYFLSVFRFFDFHLAVYFHGENVFIIRDLRQHCHFSFNQFSKINLTRSLFNILYFQTQTT